MTNVQQTTVTAAPTGGDGSYSYNWSTNGTIVSGQGTNQIELQVTGCGDLSITVRVNDSSGAAASRTWTGKPGNCPATELTLTQSQGEWGAYNTSRNSYTTTLNAHASGGVQPYVFQWSNGANGLNPDGVSSSTSIEVPAGQTLSGWVKVTDNFGTTRQQTWTVTAPPAPPVPGAPRVDIRATVTRDSTGCTYTLTASVINEDNANFTFSWTNGGTGQTTTIHLNFGQRGNLNVSAQDNRDPRRAKGIANWQDVCGSSGY
jgi:hypothetical protein